MDPKTGMRLEEFLEPGRHGIRETRSSLASIMQRAVNDPTMYHQTRSIFRRHQQILHYLYTSRQLEVLLGMRKGVRRFWIGRILGSLDTEENRLRVEIFDGNYEYKGRQQSHQINKATNTT